MFLKPTAKPVPRRTPSPRVVLPAPPGRRIGSRGGSSGSGGASAAARRIVSATGRAPVSTWPVDSVSPGASAFSSRSSTGSMPSAAASLSICASAAKQVCTAPKPRITPRRIVRVDGRRFEQRVVDAVRAGGERRGIRRHGRGRGGVRPAVEQDPHAHVDRASSLVARCSARSWPGGGGCSRRRTPHSRRPSSQAGSSAARAWRRGSASRGPRGRQTRRPRRRGGCALRR